MKKDTNLPSAKLSVWDARDLNIQYIEEVILTSSVCILDIIALFLNLVSCPQRHHLMTLYFSFQSEDFFQFILLSYFFICLVPKFSL